MTVVNDAPLVGDTTDHVDLNVSGVGHLRAIVRDSLGNRLTTKTYWISGNPRIATVDFLTGRVRALRVGYATIYAATASKITGSARACVLPSGRTPLDPAVTVNSVKIFTGRTLIPVNTLRVPDTAQMRMTLNLRARDTTARNIQSWGPCIHWTLNAGPETPTLPDTSQLRVDHRGNLLIKCCITMFYPSATIGTSLQTAIRQWIPGTRVPALRIAVADQLQRR